MGIINMTPDSFREVGKLNLSEVPSYAQELIHQGADIIDIGGESTRPGAASAVAADVQLARVVPAIEAIRQFSAIPISIDTSEPEVMQQAVAAGATLINDVRAFSYAGAMQVAAKLDVMVCIIHWSLVGKNKISEILDFFRKKIQECLAAGIKKQHILLDPGFGFNKTWQENLGIINAIHQFKNLGFTLILGISGKSFAANKVLRSEQQRLQDSVAIALKVPNDLPVIFRVHEVAAYRKFLGSKK